MKRITKTSIQTSIKSGIDCGNDFHKSSFSAATACVAVALQADGTVKIGDTKDQISRTLNFTRSEWSTFIKGVKNNEFDIN